MKRSHNRSTILLVEDEDHLRHVCALILQRAGFHVLQAHNSQEALEIWSREHAVIDLLLTDILMPGLNGREIALEVFNARPDLKIIFMSGSDRDAVSKHTNRIKSSKFLQKPFTTETLVKTVKNALALDTLENKPNANLSDSPTWR